MLRDLHVRNLAVIADASLELGPGLNILSGETGAGKSLIVDSLALLAGARAAADLIRTGARTSTVTGVFEPTSDGWRRTLAEAGIHAADDALVVRREISRAGRNRVFINDQPSTLSLLRELAPALLRIHAQREELSVLAPELQRRWLDRIGGDPAAALAEETARHFDRLQELTARLERSRGDERLRLERIDLLRFQAAEIDQAQLEPGEEVSLRAERLLLQHADAVADAIGASHAGLSEEEGAAGERLARARRRLREVAEWEPRAADWATELEEIEIRLDEVSRSLRERLDAVAADPRRLDELEDRLSTLERLFRKYGKTSVEVLDRRLEIGRELGDLDADDEHREELRRDHQSALAEYREAAGELSRRRRVWGDELVKRVSRELGELAMAGARFHARSGPRPRPGSAVEVDGEPVEYSRTGIDQVSFELAANPGEEARPLARAASGGELSRVYLALQLAVQGSADSSGPTLVFDEIDAGVGGAEAAALGGKLKRLSAGGQVVVVTHLPQVASFSDLHFKIEKRVAKGRTRIAVRRLDPRGRVEEVARMLAGDRVTDLSRSHAEELIAVSDRGGR